MFIALKTLLHTLLLPPGGPLLLAAAGAWLIARGTGGRLRRAGWVLLVAALATLWLLATPLVADALEAAAERCPALDLSRPVPAQAVVILGGAAGRLDAPEYGGEPAAAWELLERLNYGAHIARRTGLPVAVSGSGDEVLAMNATLARDFGVATRWIEDRSRDTFENAQFCAALLRPLGIKSIVLVTSANHEWRAVQEFSGAGFAVVPAPVGLYVRHKVRLTSYVPNALALAASTAALYELIGDLARRAFEILHLRQHTR
ncbi:MAG TPA: YdcF family protein [Steroidobacteraceae bacterium]